METKKESAGRKPTNLFLSRYPEEPIRVPDKGEVTIGRAEENDIVLAEPRVSRKHAVINWLEPPGVHVITDLGSSNGTFLNNKKLPAQYPGFLNEWDKIRIASTVLTVRLVDDPSEIMDEFKDLRVKVQCEMTELINLAELNKAGSRPGFSGELAHFCPLEIFQILETGGKSGLLSLKTNGGEGSYTIMSGQVVAAQFHELQGPEAVFEVLKYSHGFFAFNPENVAIKKPQITMSTTSLLMEGCRQLDEAMREDSPADTNR